LRAREGIESREGRAAFGGQAEMTDAAVIFGLRAHHEFTALEAGEEPAEIGGIESERRGEIGGARSGLMGDFEEHTGLRQRKWRVEQAFTEQADAAGVEAIESAHHLNFFIGDWHEGSLADS
jgi:hypothetical protein